MRLRGIRALAGILALTALTAGPSAAQDPAPPLPGVDAGAPPGGAVVRMNGDDQMGSAVTSPVLTVNDAALFADSAWGRRVQADIEALSRQIAAENDRIYDDLAAEEEALTELRPTLPPAEFRELAEAFDQRAQDIRAERQAALRALNDHVEAERRGFFSVAVPVFADVMAEHGALVILDQRTVFVSADSVDVTDVLIRRIDAEIGAGPAGEAGEPADGAAADEGATVDPEGADPAP